MSRKTFLQRARGQCATINESVRIRQSHSPDGQIDHRKMIIHRDTSARLDGKCVALTDELPAVDCLGGGESVANAFVLEKILGCHWTTPSREIVCATHDDPSKIVGEADRDHIALNKLADADTGIELIGRDVDRSVVHVQIDGYVWIGETKLLDDIPENELERDARNGKPESTRGPRTQRGDTLQCLTDSSRRRQEACEQCRSCLCQRDGSCR